jgi:hypothetical protein
MYGNRSYSLYAAVLSLVVLSAAHAASTVTPAAAKAPLGSSFPGPLWQLVNPNGGTASVSNGHLFLNVPGGSNHDALLSPNEAVQVVQPIGDVDFDISIKIDSALVATDASMSEGLMVLADKKDFITFAVGTNGTSISLSAHKVTGGVAATVFEDSSFREYQTPLYLRLSRTGAAYMAYYSVDGVVWVEVGSFTNVPVPTLIGPFASNYNPTPSKAVPVVMAINWFDIL